jgi:hypothetical protein
LDQGDRNIEIAQVPELVINDVDLLDLATLRDP